MNPRPTTRIRRPTTPHPAVEHTASGAPPLRLGPVDDPFERQADAVAAQVMSGMETPDSPVLADGPTVQREGGSGASSASGGMVDAAVGAEIHAAQGGGLPLPDSVRAPMERALGTDFSAVRVHTGARAASLNRALGSNAFTTGRHLFFDEGRYAPEAPEGQRLIAHELTHVLQQGGDGGGGVQRSPVVQRMPSRKQTEETEDTEDAEETVDVRPQRRVFKPGLKLEQERELRHESISERQKRERRERLTKRRSAKPSPSRSKGESTPSSFQVPSLGESSSQAFGTFPSTRSSRGLAPRPTFGFSARPLQSTPPDTSDVGSDREPSKPTAEEVREDKEALGKAAKEEIATLAKTVDDTVELEDSFDLLQRRYEMQWIKLVDLGTPRARVEFKLNPEFEVRLSGTQIEMRAQGSGTGATQTKVKWDTGKLTLDGNGDYIVGKHMLANPLSTDHPQGTGSSADREQRKWMDLLPSASGAVSDGYVKGHLLNDNLGGIAKQENLFPITGWANKQHLTYAEQYIKSGIENGYVYAYRVDIGNVKEAKLPSSEYSVDADLYFKFARLDATGSVVPKTEHEGTVKSRYEDVKANRPAGPFADKKKEFSADYTQGKKGSPKRVGSENVKKGKEKKPGTSNTGRYKDLNTTAFSFSEPTPYASDPFAAAPAFTSTIPQAINATPTFVAKLSLLQSPATTVEAQFASIVTGWSLTDITAWVTALRASKSVPKWADVQAEAVKNKLDPKIAAKVFDATGPGRTKTSINGKP